MRRTLITSLTAILGTAGLTLSLASPASAEERFSDRCTFKLTASNGDSTKDGQVVYVDVDFVVQNGYANAEKILISNYTGRSVTFVNDRWQNMYTGEIERGKSGSLDNGTATSWAATSFYGPGPDEDSRRVNVTMAATSRPGLGGGCSVYV